LLILFLAWDATMKIIKHPMVMEASRKMGFTEDAIFGIGITLLVCTILYAIPRTAVLGSILLTGYLGGAIETHVYTGAGGAFSIVFAFVFGVLVWVGLALREPRLLRVILQRKFL